MASLRGFTWSPPRTKFGSKYINASRRNKESTLTLSLLRSLDDAFLSRCSCHYVGLPGQREMEQQLALYAGDGTFSLSPKEIKDSATEMVSRNFSSE